MARLKLPRKSLRKEKSDEVGTRMVDGAVQDEDTEIEQRYIDLGIDFGTAFISAAYAVYSHGSSNEGAAINNVCFDEDNCAAPNVISMYEGRVVWGFELYKLVGAGKVDEEDVIGFMKLGLYEGISEEMSETWNDLETQLTRLNYDFDQLLADHLEAIVRDCRREIARSVMSLSVGKSTLEELPINIRISVPQMWSPSAKQRMQNAAKLANLPLVTLASEPQAVLANLMQTLADGRTRLGCELHKGETLLVSDLGAGTGDWVSNRLKDELSAHSRLDAIYESSGSLCGSQRVNEYLLAHAVEEGKDVANAGGIKAVLNQYNLSKTLWRKRALAAIEGAKLGHGKRKPHYCTIDGEEVAPLFRFSLTDSDIEQAIDHVLEDINDEIAKHVAQVKPKAIAVAGGFARSKYLLNKLREKWTEQEGIAVTRAHDGNEGAYLAVSRGSLQRYDNISAQNLPSRFGYALLQDMEYEAHKHRDAETIVQYWNDYTRSYWHELGPNPEIVFTSERDNSTQIVRDRLKMIMTKGTTATSYGPIVRTIQQVYYVSVEEPEISATFVYIDRKDAKNNGPSRRPEDQSQFLDGIYEWTCVELDLSDVADKFERAGFDYVLNKYGQERYKLTATMVFNYYGGDNLRVGWKVLYPNSCKVFWEHGEIIWDGKHSEFVEEIEDVDMTDA